MKKSSTPKITLIFLSLCVIVVLAAWIFLIYKSSHISGSIAFIAEEARNRSSESTYVSTVRNTLRDSKDALTAIENRFVAEESVPEFINVLEDKAAQVGVRTDLGSINVEPAKGDAPYPQLRVKMSGNGRWEKVVGFISTLDALPYVSRIEHVNFIKMGSSDEKNATTSWSFNLELIQYIKEKK